MGVMPTDEASTGRPGWDTIEQLFAALESPLLGYALRLTGGRAVAEDIVQEAFMRLHARFDQVREPRQWLYRTVHNLAMNHRRNTTKLVSFDQPSSDASDLLDTSESQPLPDEQLMRLEGIGLVRLSLETLDARSRELIRLKFNDELSYKEISERTGLTVGHVGYLLHHALKDIAAELAKTGGVP